MRKIFTLFAATLFVWAVNAETPSTDFAGGYQFTATAASIDGAIEKTTHGDDVYLRYYDNDPCGTAEWEITCTTSCFVTVTLNMYDNSWNYDEQDAARKLFKNGGHKFEVQVTNGSQVISSIAEASESSAIGNIALTGKLCVPAGTFTIKLLNNRAWSKCGIAAITLTNAGNIPSTDFAGKGYAFTADAATLSGGNDNTKFLLETSVTPHYIRYADHSQPGPVVAWTINATRACKVGVTLNFADNTAFYQGNKHNIEVQLWDVEGNKLDTIAEGPAFVGDGFTENGVDKVLNGYINIPEAGIYTIKMLNNRNHSKTGIYGITLTARPQVQLIGTMNEWGGEDLFALAEDGKTSSLKLNLEPNSDTGYAFKLNVGDAPNINTLSINNGTDKYGFNRGNTSAKVNYVSATSEPMWIVVDLAGEYTFTWTFADSTLAITYPAPKLANGYYLMGVINGAAATWTIADLDEDRLLVINPNKEAEYIITTELAVGDELQVVSVVLDEIKHWYPGGEGNNYVVDAAHAGENKTIYFRPDRLGDEAWWHGCIFIDANATAIDQTTSYQRQTTKTLVNGQLLIIRDGKTFNVLGAEIR